MSLMIWTQNYCDEISYFGRSLSCRFVVLTGFLYLDPRIGRPA